MPFTRILNTKESDNSNVTFTYLCKDYEKTFKSIIDSKSHDIEFSNSSNRLNFEEKMKIVNENNKSISTFNAPFKRDSVQLTILIVAGNEIIIVIVLYNDRLL